MNRWRVVSGLVNEEQRGCHFCHGGIEKTLEYKTTRNPLFVSLG